MTDTFVTNLTEIAQRDVNVLYDKDKSYGSSWKKRGGVGAFMMLARKWDRIENQVKNVPIVNGKAAYSEYDIFGAALHHTGAEGILDDIADLRRYLLLVEREVRNTQAAKLGLNSTIPNGQYEVGRVLDRTGMEHPFGYDARHDT